MVNVVRWFFSVRSFLICMFYFEMRGNLLYFEEIVSLEFWEREKDSMRRIYDLETDTGCFRKNE